MKIKTRLSGFLCLILSLMLLLTMVACGGGDSGLYIDVPSEPVECELGTYEIEIPKVRDESGAVISGKTVTIKKAAYEDGQAITVPSSNMITVEEPAIVNVTFRADGVKDAVMVLDFADRTAPEIQLISELPSMYFRNNMYAIPSYKANETLDNAKCSQKVEWLADENAAPEAVTLNGKYFKVEKNSGFYRITITLADSWGNAKDYIYEVPVGGVSEDAYREGTVVYFEDEFGLEQASDRFNNLGREFISVDEMDETLKGELTAEKTDIRGVTKVWRSDTDPAGVGEADLLLTTPYITDLSAYDYLYMDIYNPNTKSIKIEIGWGASVVLAPKAWTRASWDLDVLQNATIANSGASRSNITGLIFVMDVAYDDGIGLTVDGKESLYLTNLTAATGKDATNYEYTETDIKDDKIFYADTPAGEDIFFLRDGDWANYTVEFDESVKDTAVPEGKGMTKISFAENFGVSHGHLDVVNAYKTECNNYAYLAWRIYNPNDTAIELSYWTGKQDLSDVDYAPVFKLAAKSFGTFYISMDYLTTYGFNRIPARSVNDIWLMLQGENGAALGGKSIYFGACYGIAYDDIAVEIENPDRDMTPGNTYDGGIFYPVVSEECALEWARGDELCNVRYKLSSASMTVDGKTTLVKVNDGKFAVDTLGECTYALKYSALMYVVKKDGSLVTESEMSAFAQKEDEVVLKVTESAEPVDIDDEFVVSKYASDKEATLELSTDVVKGEFSRVIDADSNMIEATAETKDGKLLITFTASGLEQLLSGESTVQVVTLDGNTSRIYNVKLFAWDMMISNEEDLKAFDNALMNVGSGYLSGYYCLDENIDMTESTFVMGDLAGGSNDASARKFNGTFDGQGFYIKGLTLGNKGFINYLERTGVIKNLALIDATALSYKKDGTSAEQNVVHGSNILGGGWYFGTLENVYVSGSIGNGNGGYSGVVCQMRAISIKNCIFDITLRADATGTNDSALGIWVTGDTADRSVGTVENFIAITTTDKVANWSGDPIEFPVYANDAECYAGTAQTKFEAPWSRTEEGIFFGSLKVVGADALPVDLDGVTELCKEESVNLTKITVGKDEISGTVTGILNTSGEELKFTQSESGDNLVLTIASESLGKLGYGETFLQILTNDSGARFTYNAHVIVWEAYISNEAELIAFDTAFVATANKTAFPGWYRLDADIDLTKSTHIFGDRTTGNSNNGSNVLFTGTFDGQGHSITGIKTGNSGMFGYVERTGVIKNLAIIDALGQGDFCACILGGGWFTGTLENVYISGKLEKCSYTQPGVCPQFRAKSMKNVVFDIEKASDDANNILLGIWVMGNYDNGEMASTALENVIVISSVGEAAISWAGNGAKPTYSLYTDAASCLAKEDFSKFDSSVWEKKADGVYFNGKKVIEGTQQA